MNLANINTGLGQMAQLTTASLIDFVDRNPLTGDPSQEDLRRFLGLAATACGGNHGSQKVGALDILGMIPMGGPSPHYPRLPIRPLIFDLALRVLEPRLIDQKGFGLCGPAAFAVMLAKTQPGLFAKLAADLLTGGKATLNFLRIEPNEALRDYAPPDTMSMSPADWLILASIRNSDDALEGELGRYGGTDGREMFAWLRDAGYPTVVALPLATNLTVGPEFLKSVITHTLLFNYHPRWPRVLEAYNYSRLNDPYTNLQVAQMLAKRGWRVLLMITEKLATTVGAVDPIAARSQAVGQAFQLLNQPIPPGQVEAARRAVIEGLVGSNGSNHWVVAKEIMISADLKVRVVRYSYGDKDTTAPIPRDVFLKVYGGFVAATEAQADET